MLHLGFVLHEVWRERLAEGAWLHTQLAKAASRTVGIDYLHDEVEAISRTMGFECYSGDVMQLDRIPLSEKFDVIVCGELIEHVESARDLLEGMKRFCRDDTAVIITTPNPWDRKWLQKVRAGLPEEQWINLEHVVWYSPYTLRNTLSRCGYEVLRAEYYFENSHQLDKSLVGLTRWHWLAKRLARRVVTRRQFQPGLFFVARVKEFVAARVG